MKLYFAVVVTTGLICYFIDMFMPNPILGLIASFGYGSAFGHIVTNLLLNLEEN